MNMSVNGLAISWQPVQGVPRLLPKVSLDKLKQTSETFLSIYLSSYLSSATSGNWLACSLRDFFFFF